jgi:hypothetical protein
VNSVALDSIPLIGPSGTNNAELTWMYTILREPGSVIGIATGYGLDGPGRDRIPVGTRFSTLVQTGPGAHPASCTMSTGSFPGVKSSRGGDADPSPPFSAVVMK